MPKPNYTGRFAPTPSGPLHFGSIVAALGSYLQAKSNQGKWLVRIDDVDLARSVSGADKIILEQLESLGLYWDEEIVYQSQRFELYQSALEKLQSLNCTYACACSRKIIDGNIYPGTCRNGIKPGETARSIRIRTDDNETGIVDLLQGSYTQRLESEIGDFIIKRADDFFAYHLATVVDDAEQNITEIVRGIDLLESTPRQVYLQRKLNLFTPSYLHLPIAIDKSGKKISKSAGMGTTSSNKPNEILFKASSFLGMKPPERLKSDNIESILAWAIESWKPEILPREKEIMINDSCVL